MGKNTHTRTELPHFRRQKKPLQNYKRLKDNAARAYALSEVALYFHNVGDFSRAVLLMHAEKVSDPEWCQAFLENVVENRAIVERWEKLKKSDTLLEA